MCSIRGMELAALWNHHLYKYLAKTSAHDSPALSSSVLFKKSSSYYNRNSCPEDRWSGSGKPFKKISVEFESQRELCNFKFHLSVGEWCWMRLLWRFVWTWYPPPVHHHLVHALLDLRLVTSTWRRISLTPWEEPPSSTWDRSNSLFSAPKTHGCWI